jgi:hypothetical protein
MSPLREAIETHKSLPDAASFGTEQSHRRLEPDTAPTLSLRFRHGNSDPRRHLADLDEATDRRHFRQALPGQPADKNWREKGHRQPITRSRGWITNGQREGGWVIHFPSVVCTSSPNTTKAYGGHSLL